MSVVNNVLAIGGSFSGTSDEDSWVTGADFSIDGGATA